MGPARDARLPAALVLLAALAAGCANRPESIHASYVSHEKFSSLGCQQLLVRQSEVRAELTRVSELQDSKANADAVGVFLLGIPFSKLSGDHEADVARLKGELEALDTALSKAGCRDGTAAAPSAVVHAAADLEGRLGRLTDLRARGVIGEAEHDRQRQRLLDEWLDGRGAATAVAAAAVAPAEHRMQSRPAPLNGLRLTLRDADPYSGVTLGEVDVQVSAVTAAGYELNGGAIVLDPHGLVLRGALPGLVLAGVGGGLLERGATVQAQLVSPADVPPVSVKLSVLSERRLRVGDHELPVLQVAVSGFTGGTLITFNYKPGTLVAGELMVEPQTGMILAGALRSQAPAYAFKREPVRARPR